jgi:hypothetical protein
MSKSLTADMHVTRRAWLAWGIFVFCVPFHLHYNYILNAFYHFGAPYPDGGLLAHLVWHNAWRLMVPEALGKYSYFATHFVPFFLLLNELSYIVPIPMPEFYAGFIAAIYASLSLALYYACSLCVTPRNHLHMVGLVVLAISFAFNSVIMDGIWHIHFEYAIPLGIFLFVLCYARGHRTLAVLFFILTLLQREDAGFHLAAVLGLVAVIKGIEHRSLKAIQGEAGFIIYACLFSLLALWVNHVLSAMYHLDDRFTAIYSGTPPFAHLSWPLLLHRAKLIGEERIYLWLGFLLTVWCAMRGRNPYLIVGFAAYIPWAIVNWLAYNPNTARLFAYYAFPFTLSLCWPLLGVMLRYRFPLPRDDLREALTLQAMLVVTGLLMWNSDARHLEFGPIYGARWGAYRLQEGARHREVVRDVIRILDSGPKALGELIADSSALSLMAGSPPAVVPLSGKAIGHADTLVFLHPVPGPRLNLTIAFKVLKKHSIDAFCVPETTICFLTTRTAQQMNGFPMSLKQQPLPPELEGRP